ncbi:potassium channel family protein [Holdemania massiliensis]|uniref:Trk system potassium uptake protein TrkA n=1 Tax=Holdemania massiliensis TaxID=1468449 RepID=A0A6N7S711_9FIRM|nr:NAD-binding protein [Holdemania massiliensis]MSA71084.1 TrkA family potassium uptake protein [Holdemania massiliensis]MSA89410.1 TrkA family potassium uptake protein [Holdemania massiliensis]MSB78163.1 TrkA family potassium uptake protein [Holdemania massiliensis]MSC33088.1 TrkA family potassium uptake protein [Holdemania massiliensis]MSC39602.1 TrkA family potassium uptake protein [Holdemania massiliensis]
MKKRILIIGGYHKAESLAKSFLHRGYAVIVINKNPEHCHTLAQIAELTVLIGDGSKPFVLEDAGAEKADIAIALTPFDEDNLVICQLCKKRFHVRKTVSLAADPEKISFFYSMGIDSVVCALSTITQIVEQQAFLDEFTTLLPLGHGELRISELRLNANSPVIGKTLSAIGLSHEVIIAAILRQDQHLVPHGDTVLWAQDILILIAAAQKEAEAVKVLTGR